MRWTYNFLFFLMLPFIFLRLWRKSFTYPDYKVRWSERCGKVLSDIPAGVLWWHAVSMGETLASIPLIKALQQRYPNLALLVTTMTASGSLQLKKALGESVYHQYIPYDFAPFMSRFIRRIKPVLCVIMETEIWPNLIYYCHYYKIPLLLANARLSEKSAKGYQRFIYFTRPIVNYINKIAAQYDSDAQRFAALGFPVEKLVITGSVKFDMTISSALINQARHLIRVWGLENKSIWIAASTHAGEEKIIINVQKNLKNTLLILVPRHPERSAEVLALCKQANLKTVLRSRGENPDSNTDIFLINTAGELLLFYAMAKIAFVGNSLNGGGGHNLVEPAVLGLPIIAGEALYNFSEIEKLLDNSQALIKIKNSDQLLAALQELLDHPEQSKSMGESAKSVVLQNKGAINKHLILIENLLLKK